jgi:hypothetical protein
LRPTKAAEATKFRKLLAQAADPASAAFFVGREPRGRAEVIEYLELTQGAAAISYLINFERAYMQIV